MVTGRQSRLVDSGRLSISNSSSQFPYRRGLQIRNSPTEFRKNSHPLQTRTQVYERNSYS